MSGIALFNHAGCGNHGCEAIVRGFLRGLRTIRSRDLRSPQVACGSIEDAAPGDGIRLITHDAAQDLRYLPEGLCAVEEERHLERHFLAHVAYYGYRRLTGDRESFQRYRFPMLLGKGAPSLAISIGGDNYCYPDMVPDLILADRMLAGQGTATALLGCSIEPDALAADRAMAEDLKGHILITARESLTHGALLEAGVPEERLRLLPDPAFAMASEARTLSEAAERKGRAWEELAAQGQIVGLNVSPLVERYRGEGGTALESFVALAGHILEATDLGVALIPHVVWPSSDDRGPLGAIYERFADTGRIALLRDAPAPVLKGDIARCRFFVGARTHATIAAYSSLVPTLVVGYSVKSRGIAQDLFGSAEGLVLPVDALTPQGLIRGFEDLRTREPELRAVLRERMPETCRLALQNGAEMERVYHEQRM